MISHLPAATAVEKIAAAPGYVSIPERTPYPAVVLQQNPRSAPNGRVTVVASIWLQSSLVMLEVLYPDGMRRAVPTMYLYDPEETDRITLFPRARQPFVVMPGGAGGAA